MVHPHRRISRKKFGDNKVLPKFRNVCPNFDCLENLDMTRNFVKNLGRKPKKERSSL